MNRYREIFETVSRIVNENGEGILSEPKFWGLLTDLYPFAHETKLKEAYRDCVSFGWVSAIASLPADREKAVEFISRIVETNPKDIREELSAALFSAAIAAGKCTEADYRSFINVKPQSFSGQTTPSGQSASNTRQRRKASQRKQKRNETVLYVIIAALVVIASWLLFKSCHHEASTDAEEKKKTEAVEKYEKKTRENEELIKNRKDFDSALRVKNIELGSDYRSAVEYMKSKQDFHDCEEGYYELDNSGGLHPVFQLMDGRVKIKPKGKAGESAGKDTISGKVFISKMVLDTIPIEIRVFELNGKVPFIMIEDAGGEMSAIKHISSFIRLYYEKYGLPEHRTFDGTPYNPEKDYGSIHSILKPKEDDVWTFSQGTVRRGVDRILYATRDFLDSITLQFERTSKEYEERVKAEAKRIEESIRRSRREDSIRRAKNHENAIKDI